MQAFRPGGRHMMALTVALSVSSWWPMAAGAGKNTKPAAEYRREVYLGVAYFQYPAGFPNCVYLGASFSSGGFFEGLTLTDSPAGPQFQKQGRIVEAFPDTLLLEVRAILNLTGCHDVPKVSRDGKKLRIEVPGLGLPPADRIDLGDSLRFEVALVKGISPAPAEVISTRATKVPFTETGPAKWDYEILVRTGGAPLTGQVKLTVLSRDGRFLGRMLGGLASPVSRRLYSAKKGDR